MNTDIPGKKFNSVASPGKEVVHFINANAVKQVIVLICMANANNTAKSLSASLLLNTFANKERDIVKY